MVEESFFFFFALRHVSAFLSSFIYLQAIGLVNLSLVQTVGVGTRMDGRTGEKVFGVDLRVSKWKCSSHTLVGAWCGPTVHKVAFAA